MKIGGIARDTLRFILEASRAKHPREFAGLMEADRSGLIVAVHILPGTTSDEESAQVPTHMLPLGVRLAGTVHSHPVDDFSPSDEDLHFFAQGGERHIIVAWPYRETTWACYDPEGRPARLAVLDDPARPEDRKWEEEIRRIVGSPHRPLHRRPTGLKRPRARREP